MGGNIPVACGQSRPKNTIYDFLKRESTGPLEIKKGESAMNISGSLSVQ